MPTNALTAKIAAAMAAAILATGTTAAAASTGELPAPAQKLISASAAVVGLELPDGEEVPVTTTTTTIVTTTTTITVPETTVPPAVDAAKPGPETCEAARAETDAKGCSAVAKAHAPGQVKKAENVSVDKEHKLKERNGKAKAPGSAEAGVPLGD